jgi:hypothetical protein
MTPGKDYGETGGIRQPHDGGKILGRTNAVDRNENVGNIIMGKLLICFGYWHSRDGR